MDVLAEWAADAPVTVYLFGSRARGDHQQDSDVDLYIQYQDGNQAAGDEWYDRQIDSDFAELKPKLPGPLSKVMPPWGAAYPLVLPGAREITRKENVVAYWTPQKPPNKRRPN
jgi:predicted nucleotidyltransferase